MKAILLALALAPLAAVPASAEQGCIETSSVTVTATICAQFDCVQRSGGNCVNWACVRTQTSKYLDSSASGCTRVANCGRAAFFSAGAPQEADTDSTEQCDWYPCVEADAGNGACLSYLCVSKRVTQVTRNTFPEAKCVPMPAGMVPPEEKRTVPAKAKPAAPRKLQPRQAN